MIKSSRSPAKANDGPLALWDDGERVFCRERRPDANGKLIEVLTVKPLAEPPAPGQVDRLAQEYGLRDALDGAWALRPLELIRERGRTILVLEDPGGTPLEQQLDRPMELGLFLRIAHAIAMALAQVHRHGLIHKDLKPANILICRSGQVKFTGFGIASRQSREHRALGAPDTVAGTLAYMAPEQTGRMNRAIDCRSDLYALGVTLYRMATGTLPFTTSDPIEWLHSHIARRPLPPSARVKNLPCAVSAIIMKLLAKTAEERYQTAAGLMGDLERCLRDWNAKGRIDDFALGSMDQPDQLLMPERLHGRDQEIDALLASFTRVAKGGMPELVLVAGYSGVGKSALVHELRKSLVQGGGLFAAGKFEQHGRDIPYSTLAQAFQSLVRTLLAKSEVELAPWRDALREALGPLGQLMVDLVPELQLVIGAQPPAPEASPRDALRRFQHVVHRFIGVFARASHPLALFFDDLQWLDAATLDLIQDLLARSELRHLLLVGAYRDNDVDAQHPLTEKLERIRRSGARVQTIDLLPLTRDGVETFTASVLHCDRPRVAALAGLIHEKTGGNPFFLIQFLYALAEEGFLSFDHEKTQWRWDLERIHAKGYTDNVADLMVSKLGGLPHETQAALLELACFGSGAEVKMLALARGTSEAQVHADFREADRLDLVRRLERSYAFVHDRVREAAYALQPDADSRAGLHLRIGMALAMQLTSEATSERIYIVANQLNRGVTASRRAPERDRIIAVNLSAAQRARNATAYQAAIGYLDVVRGLIGEKAEPPYDVKAFAINLLRAECQFLVGNVEEAEAQLLALSQNCPSLQASADVTRLRAQLYTSGGEIERAVEVCLAFLRQVGIDWSAHPTRAEVDEDRCRLRLLADRLSDDQLHMLPPMRDAGHRATIGVLADLLTPAVLTDRNLCDIMILTAARLTLAHGVCAASCYPLTTIFGVLASNSADAELGFRLSRFGAALADRQPQWGLSGRALLVFGLHVTPWVQPIRSGLPFIERGLKVSLAAGDLAFAAYSHRGLVSVRLFCGDPLAEVSESAEQALAFVETSPNWLSSEFLAVQRDLARALMGRDAEHSFDVPRPIAAHPSEPSQALTAFFHYTAQIELNVLAGRHNVAIALAELTDRLSWCARAYSEFAEYRFYLGLAHAAAFDAAAPAERETHANVLREQRRKLAIWSARSPDNFAARHALLSAELARIDGDGLAAEQLYEEAIRLAQEAGFVQIEAIAGECAARFYEARGIRTVVLSYLAHARDCYRRWGAEAKVAQLDDTYPQLQAAHATAGPISTIGTPAEQLDLAMVLKVSEAVSGEIVLEKLLEKLLRMAIEHAGAERGLLILQQGSDLRIRAEASIDGEAVSFTLRDCALSDRDLPQSLILYAVRMQESVRLDDASTRGAFTGDAYISGKRARSVLTVPLLRQGKLLALLYFENNLAPRVFTPARVAVLKYLAAEAATSLDNARLLQELQEREARIRRLVDANIIGMHIFNSAGVIVDANQAFLKIIGYDQSDVAAGKLRYFDLTPPEWKSRSALARAEMEMTGTVQPFEKEYFRKDGSRVPVLIGSVAFDGGRDQGVTFVLDLSERKRAEAEARESEQRYRRTQMELEHANRVAVMGQLTASIAHEVNQPSTAVIASAQAALRWLDRRPPELEKVRQALARVEQNATRASEVIGRIRDLIKKAPPRKDSLAINRVIQEVIELTQGEAEKHGISVRTDFAEHLGEIVGDRVELQQVAVNLILNAIEAMSGSAQQQRDLLIRTARTDDGGVLVAVLDSGPGLPPASLERLFEPFYTTKAGGLGVGLSICRSIVESHGGRLWASERSPRGAIFQFTLPNSGWSGC